MCLDTQESLVNADLRCPTPFPMGTKEFTYQNQSHRRVHRELAHTRELQGHVLLSTRPRAPAAMTWLRGMQPADLLVQAPLGPSINGRTASQKLTGGYGKLWAVVTQALAPLDSQTGLASTCKHPSRN